MNKLLTIFIFLLTSSCLAQYNLFELIDSDVYLEDYITQRNIEIKNDLGETPLLYACSYQKVAAVSFLIKKGANINAVSNSGRSCLMYAVNSRNNKFVTMLIQNNADINQVSARGETALTKALGNLDLTLTKKLIKLGTDPHQNKNNYNSLILFSAKGDYDFSKELVEKYKLDVNAVYRPHAYSALLQAVEYNYPKIVTLLLDHSANMYHRDRIMGMTALELARFKKYKEIEQILLDAGAKY